MIILYKTIVSVELQHKEDGTEEGLCIITICTVIRSEVIGSIGRIDTYLETTILYIVKTEETISMVIAGDKQQEV